MKKLLAALMMCSIMLVNAAPVMADTSNEPIAYKIESSSGGFHRCYPRDKQNSTKIFLDVHKAPYTFVQVQVYGDRNTSKWHNETIGGTATVKKGVKSSISSYVYERRGKNHTYLLCKVGIRSGNSKSGDFSADWSPDSTKNYTVVN